MPRTLLCLLSNNIGCPPRVIAELGDERARKAAVPAPRLWVFLPSVELIDSGGRELSNAMPKLTRSQ
jgi:hypothetical protein